jgi:hypothetical protein
MGASKQHGHARGMGTQPQHRAVGEHSPQLHAHAARKPVTTTV